jgi:hypothetical protein
MTDKIKIPENAIEIRCPGKFNKLFLILRQEHMPEDGMLMEIACADCAKWARSNGAPGTGRFLHYYNSAGECVANKVVASPATKAMPVFLTDE